MADAESPQSDAVKDNTSLEERRFEADKARWKDELEIRRNELDLKAREARLARLINPLTITIIGAIIAALVNILLSHKNNLDTLNLEAFKAESGRILEVLKSPDPAQIRKNLEFLLRTNLISTPSVRHDLQTYLTDTPDTGLPSTASSAVDRRESYGVLVGKISGAGRVVQTRLCGQTRK